MARSLLAFALAVTSCAASGEDASPDQRRLTTAGRALCDAQRLAGDGDVAAADRVFQDDVHSYLHDLADRLSTFDRAAAGDLLVAKQRVEGAFAAAAVPADVAALLDDLVVALDAAARAADLDAPACEAAA
jgi:hypothetical protein